MTEHTGDISDAIGDIKRFYIDLVITKDCPNCGKKVTYDLSDNYISYPAEDDILTFYCWDGCDHEWEVPVKIKATATITEV